MSTNHADVVASVIAALKAQGKDLSGSCGAFEITKHVAWQLKGEQAGLLVKTSGNNCQGFAVDIIMYPDGSIYDILTDSGASNGPSWNASDPVDPSRYHAAIDPQDGSGTTIPNPPPVTPTPAAGVDLGPILAALNAISSQLNGLALQITACDANNERRYLDLIAHFNNLPKPQAPAYEGSIFGVKFTANPKA